MTIANNQNLVITIEHIPTGRKELAAICWLVSPDRHREFLADAKKLAKKFKLFEMSLGVWLSELVKIEVLILDGTEKKIPLYDRPFWEGVIKSLKVAK